MKRFLFVFGYQSPVECATNVTQGTDFESSNAIWVWADSEEDALQKGRDYANQFVRRLYQEDQQAGKTDLPNWVEDGFAHWISRNPIKEFSGVALDTLDEI
jgi:hypothetical protein